MFQSRVIVGGPLQRGVLPSDSLHFPLSAGRDLCEGNCATVYSNTILSFETCPVWS